MTTYIMTEFINNGATANNRNNKHHRLNNNNHLIISDTNMFSKLRKKDKTELKRVNSNETVRSNKSMFRLFNFKNEDKTYLNSVDIKQDIISKYLTSNGLSVPKELFDDKIKISLSSDNIFLPTLIRDEEDDELIINDGNNGDNSENITHTFAVVINVPQPTKLSIEMKLKCICKNHWPSTDEEMSIKDEVFQLGELRFKLSLQNYNVFIPGHLENPSFNDNIIKPTIYKPFDVEKIIDSPYYKDIKTDPTSIHQTIFPPGDYIYLVPISFPLSVPESIITEHASINYSLDFNLNINEDQEDYLQHFVNLIRSTPKLDVSTFNKPIYINKTWDNALNYEISFPKKFVTIGEKEIPIKLNFNPLVKKLKITKVKVNILQKIAYLNKDLTHERFEFDESKFKNGHAVHLLEIRSDEARYSTYAAREDTISSSCLHKGNFLTCSYANTNTNDNDNEDEDNEDEELIGPLKITTYIPFMRPSKPNRFYRENQFFNENIHLKELLIHKNNHEPQAKARNQGSMNDIALTPKTSFTFIDGLLPSASTTYIRIQHKLQISLRITRDTDRLHNYEVIIDTPIYLLNSACTPESIELPPYIDIDLPSFEEALTSPITSPMISPYEETYLSRTNTMLSQLSTTNQTNDLVDQIDDLVLNENETESRRPSNVTVLSQLMRTLSKDPPNYKDVLDDQSDLTEWTPSSLLK